MLCNLACKVQHVDALGNKGASFLNLGSEERLERFRMLGDAIDRTTFVKNNMGGVLQGRITKLLRIFLQYSNLL